MMADGYREDLKNAGMGNGKHKFDFVPKWKDYKPGIYSVTLYGSVGGTIYEILGSGKTYQIFALSVGSKVNSGEVAGLDPINSIQHANDASSAYMRCGYTTKQYIDPDFKTLKNNLMARVQFFSCHGDYDHIRMKKSGISNNGNAIYPDGTVFIGTDTIDSWKNNTKLVTYAACWSAGHESADNNSIVFKTVANGGAECALGFYKKIYSESVESWTKRYNDQLANGATVKEAAEYANTFLYLHPTITYWRIVWNSTESNMKICSVDTNSKTSLNNINEVNTENNRNILDNNLLERKTVNKDNITEIIKENNKNFNINDYEVRERDGGIITNIQTGEVKYAPKYIDYQLKIGDFYTEAGYTVEIVNNEGIAIYDNNIDLERQNLALKNIEEFKNNNENIKLQLENEAINGLRIKNREMENVITSEKIDNSIYFYDIKENKKYLMVNVESKISNNGYDSYAVETIKYEL